MMQNGFDRDGFMSYLKSVDEGYNDTAFRIVQSIIDYGLKHERISRDQFVYWLYDMIPGLELGAIAQFVANGSLTIKMQDEKRQWYLMHNNIKYIEITFTNNECADDAVSYCIMANHFPTIHEVKEFWGNEPGYFLSDVLEITKEEAYIDYDMRAYQSEPGCKILGM